MTTELKPCPFCSGKVEATSRGSEDQLVVFKCEDGSPCIGSGMMQFAKAETLESAVAIWNTRATPSPVTELVRYEYHENRGEDLPTEDGRFVLASEAERIIGDLAAEAELNLMRAEKAEAKSSEILKRAKTAEKRLKLANNAFERERKQNKETAVIIGDLAKRAETAEAKLAESKKQVPVGSIATTKINSLNGLELKIFKPFHENFVMVEELQLYAHPVADREAETIERCRKAVRNAVLRMKPEDRLNGDICDDVIAIALRALSGKEPA